MPMNRLLIFIFLIFVVILSIFGITTIRQHILPTQDATANGNETGVCTLEAKICPDGSSVGRSGQNCEFAPCPNP